MSEFLTSPLQIEVTPLDVIVLYLIYSLVSPWTGALGGWAYAATKRLVKRIAAALRR